MQATVQIRAIIRERGNGFPSKGDYVAGDDCSLYRVMDVGSNIHAGQAHLGEGNWIEALVEEVDWGGAPREFPALAIVQADTSEDLYYD